MLGNPIFSNGGDGVQIDSGNENPISRNSIYGNGGLGIDFGAGIPNINSNCQSSPTGATSQNAPVLTSGSGDHFISATATDQNGNTSDFSNCATVSGTDFSALGTFNGCRTRRSPSNSSSTPPAIPRVTDRDDVHRLDHR